MTSHELVRLLACVDAALFVALVGAMWWRRRRRERHRTGVLNETKACNQDRPRQPFPPAPGPQCSDDEELEWEDAVGEVLAQWAADADRLTQAMTPGEIDVTIRALVAAYRKSEKDQSER